MNARNDQATTYSRAYELVREYWKNAEGEVRCPECRHQQIDYRVWEASDEVSGHQYTLWQICEYCNRDNKINFDVRDEW